MNLCKELTRKILCLSWRDDIGNIEQFSICARLTGKGLAEKLMQVLEDLSID